MSSRATKRFVTVAMHIGKVVILGSWIVGVVHEEYVHYHPIGDLLLSISPGMECSRLGALGVQYCLEA